MKIRIATRRSPLALVQTQWVAARLATIDASLEVALHEMVTVGDRVRDVPLAQVGGKGLFVSELEEAVQQGKADLAVHSLKDLPADLAPGLVLACVPEREDPRDALVTKEGIELFDLTAGDRVGTSSLRRMIQLRRLRNDLEYASLRGNVDTRIAKLEAGQYQAIVLALAGLRRLGLAERPMWPMPIEISIPAVGQGALAIECREDDGDLRALLSRLEHADSRACIEAERAFLRALGGDCHTPLAGYAHFEEDGTRLRFDGLVGAVGDHRMLQTGIEEFAGVKGPARIELARALGTQAAEALLMQGAGELIREATEQATKASDPRMRPQ